MGTIKVSEDKDRLEEAASVKNPDAEDKKPGVSAGPAGDAGLYQLPGDPKGLVHEPDWAQLEDAYDGASFGDGIEAHQLLGLVVEFWGGYPLGDGNLDLHGGAIPWILRLLNQGAVYFIEHFLGHRLAKPGAGGIRCLGEDHLVELEHLVVECFDFRVGLEVTEGHVDGQALDWMLLAAPPNARIQASVPSYSICGRSTLRPPLLKAKPTLRAGNGPMIVQAGLFAPKVAPPPPQDPFYNRVTELDYFTEKFSGEVGFVTVLVGPRNCGKSRLLEELLRQYEQQNIGPLFLKVDARFTPVRSPDEVSKALVSKLDSGKIERIEKSIGRNRFISLLTSLKIKVKLSSSLPFFKSDLEAELAKELKEDEGKLEPTINKFDKILEALQPLPRKPVIVIDEANDLMDWKEPNPLQPELKQLLAFLIGISKQKRLMHVILATSDYFLANWLTQVGMTEDKFRVEVLGDLTEEEAEKFMYGDGVAGGWRGIVNDSLKTKEDLANAKDQWSEIYQRCGGNIGLLKQCVAEARGLKGSWGSALQAVVAGPLGAVTRGFEPEVYIAKGGEAPLWTDVQWRMVLERITTAPQHAVLASELKEELGKGSEKKGSEIFLSMVKYNLLALRPPSTLARDLPQDVYENGGVIETVVTLPLPAHVWAAKALLKSMKAKEGKNLDPQL
ncbi:hypothetical protein KSW81_006224 [Nannochloris sp. 'desiccata']|nr:hypothetical protein KSW81_006224 [Chlorella desiccata (nom. nud.)]